MRLHDIAIASEWHGNADGARMEIGLDFFDAHCDTATGVMAGALDFRRADGGGQVNLPALGMWRSWTQVFACFVPSNLHPATERATAEKMIHTLRRLAAESRMTVVLKSSDLPEGGSSGLAAIISLEAGDPLEGDPQNLEHFFALGVRSLIPAWHDNCFSGTATGENKPLSRAGEDLVRLAEGLGVMIDVSHLSDAAFYSVRRVAKRPFIASHSNCRVLCPSLRNLTDDMIVALAEQGGVAGVNLYSKFLDPSCGRQHQGAAASRADIAWVARHVRHAIEVGGEDCVGLGGDLDSGGSLAEGIETVRDYGVIVDALAHAGLSSRQIEKVCHVNFRRVFREVLPT